MAALGFAIPKASLAQAFFPIRPAHAQLQAVDGVLTDYGIGNDGGFLEIKDEHGRKIEFDTSGVKIDGRYYDCSKPPEAGKPLRVSPECRQWPENVRINETRVRVLFWPDREPVTDARTGKASGFRSVLATDELHVLPSRVCFFRTQDRTPPSIVRAAPAFTSTPVSKLANHSAIVPVGAQGGWLKLALPHPGWLAFGLLRFYCGADMNGADEALATVQDWGKAGASGNEVEATRLGWAIASGSLDGVLAEAADDGFSAVILRRPDLSIRVIEGLPPRTALRFLAEEMDGAEKPVRAAFERAMQNPANAGSLAHKVWPDVQRELDARRRRRGY